jgi:SMI1-KNR4 cell-wall
MTPDTLARLKNEFESFPIMVAESLPTIEEIEQASSELGIPFTSDYIAFLRLFGGAMVSAYPIFGLRPVPIMGKQRWSVVEMTKLCRQESIPCTDNWVVFSEDLAGNPVGFDISGIVWTHDHDFGGIARLYDSFEQYVRERCLKIV